MNYVNFTPVWNSALRNVRTITPSQRLAALNLMEEAIEARKVSETANRSLEHGITERKRVEEAQACSRYLSIRHPLGLIGLWFLIVPPR